MASQLVGLFRSLTWKDFKQITQPAPGPGQRASAAQTQTKVGTSPFSLAPIPVTRPAQYQLADTVSVTISFDAANSWKASWIATLSQAEQDRILKHEQGHYNLVALLGRDFFLELMLLKAKTYSNQQNFQTDLSALKSGFLDQIQPIQDKYDSETNHGMIQARQDRWNDFIKSAFTVLRVPAAMDASGIPLKQPILEILTNAGIVL